jgi:hypothetical protein
MQSSRRARDAERIVHCNVRVSAPTCQRAVHRSDLLGLAGHPRLTPALAVMFDEPARPWLLPELARSTGPLLKSKQTCRAAFWSVNGPSEIWSDDVICQWI